MNFYLGIIHRFIKCWEMTECLAMKKLGKVTKGGGDRVLESRIRSWEANRLSVW